MHLQRTRLLFDVGPAGPVGLHVVHIAAGFVARGPERILWRKAALTIMIPAPVLHLSGLTPAGKTHKNGNLDCLVRLMMLRV